MEESLLGDEMERIGAGGQWNYDYKVSYLNRADIHKRGVRREGRKYRVNNYACAF